MRGLTQIDNFTQLFVNNIPLIDIRAPIEFEQGSFPDAQNLPLINNKERELVGICYQHNNQAQAIQMGHELVQGELKQARINGWLTFVKNNPNGALYCFRGGIRSQIAQQWIFDCSRIDYPRIKGGYKALRQFLIKQTQCIMANITPIVIGGQTGCGKTLLLEKINNKINLEALANHRGSAFGNTTTKQPTQIAFENNLAIELIKKQQYARLIFEDEGANIGTVHVPECVKNKTTQADLVLLEADISKRIQISMDAYVINMHQNFIAKNQQKGFENFSHYWQASLHKIQKRLGLERYKTMYQQLELALAQLQSNGIFDGFFPLVESLLVGYYDPMYNYQIKNKRHKVVFTGDAKSVKDYIDYQINR